MGANWRHRSTWRSWAARRDRLEVVEHLVDLLDDRALAVREAAARALGTIGDARALPGLEHVRRRDPDSRVVRFAREASAAIRAGRSGATELSALRNDVDRLQHENRNLRDRLETLEMLGGVKGPVPNNG